MSYRCHTKCYTKPPRLPYTVRSETGSKLLCRRNLEGKPEEDGRGSKTPPIREAGRTATSYKRNGSQGRSLNVKETSASSDPDRRESMAMTRGQAGSRGGSEPNSRQFLPYPKKQNCK